MWSEDGPTTAEAAAATAEGSPANADANTNANTNADADIGVVTEMHSTVGGPIAPGAPLEGLAPDAAQGPEEDVGADNDDPAEMPTLQPQPVARDSDETAPGVADRSSLLWPPRVTRRSRSLKVCRQLAVLRVLSVTDEPSGRLVLSPEFRGCPGLSSRGSRRSRALWCAELSEDRIRQHWAAQYTTGYAGPEA